MKKLSLEQERLLKNIKERITTAKEYADYRSYYNMVESKHYNGAYKDYDTVLERDGEYLANRYKKYWEMALNNIVVVIAKTTTLKALEKAGHIRIINIGGSTPDMVELLD